MKKPARIILFLALSWVAFVGLVYLSTSDASAAKLPQPSPADARIRTVVYSPRDVVQVQANYGFALYIQFADYERVTDVAAGDTVAWQVAQTADGSGIMLKPMETNAATNLIVNTSHRSYVFDLKAAQAESAAPSSQTFRVNFVYPEDQEKAAKETLRKAAVTVSDAPVGPDAYNFEYEFSGSGVIKPKRVFDDGKFTFFDFGDSARVPAIFAVDAEGNESVVNFHRRGRYLVVERVDPQFTLRDGVEVTCIFNRAAKQHPEAVAMDERAPL